ncbi:hypothetical protein PO883_31025 [Massilia sp. DJPM01]|uniref:hypothetical protein n=1 Tax=Massilia sp. DJPM01 TaxID=3024404 RepID=UPI00259FC912|nr:hypothetical protein [Massilia sp. DJPM01]MDM5181614.1 hypothetical protein [Massilia sp. DJPM01]
MQTTLPLRRPAARALAAALGLMLASAAAAGAPSPALLQRCAACHGASADAGDDGSNDLIVSRVVRSNELHSWFIGGHLAAQARQGD